MKLAKLFEAAAVLVAGIALGSATQASYQRQVSQTQQAPGTPAVVYVVVTATPEGEAAQPEVASTSGPTPTRWVITVGPMFTLAPTFPPPTSAPPTSTTEPTSTMAVQVATIAPATIALSATSQAASAPAIGTPVSPPVSAEVANDAVNVRTLPGRNAERLTQLARGTSVTIFQRQNVDGELWARVSFLDGTSPQDGWILQSLLTPPGRSASAPRPTFTSAPAAGGSGGQGTTGGLGLAPGFQCPRNCDGARAMGLSAEQAATCPGSIETRWRSVLRGLRAQSSTSEQPYFLLRLLGAANAAGALSCPAATATRKTRFSVDFGKGRSSFR